MTEAEISRIRNEFESKASQMEIKKKIEVGAPPSPRLAAPARAPDHAPRLR